MLQVEMAMFSTLAPADARSFGAFAAANFALCAVVLLAKLRGRRRGEPLGTRR